MIFATVGRFYYDKRNLLDFEMFLKNLMINTESHMKEGPNLG